MSAENVFRAWAGVHLSGLRWAKAEFLAAASSDREVW